MRPLPAPLRADALLAVALAGWWLLEADGLSAAGGAALVLMTVPLGWRRVAPLAVIAVVAAGFAIGGLEDDPAEPLAQLVATLVATWSVAVHAGSWSGARAGLLVGLAGGAGEALLLGEDLGFILILTAAAWGAGAATRRLHGRSRELEQRAVVLDERARTAAADERARIARELHDVVSHSVSLMVVQAGAAEQVLRSDPQQAEQALRAVQATGRAAVDDLRRMLGLLRDDDAGVHSRAPQPGLAALGTLIDAHDAAVELDRDQHPALPAGVDLAAYRIVQEALTNARKHAPGRPTSIRVGWDGGRLELAVRTAGAASAGASSGAGHGLVGMQERVALYGGSLETGADERGDWVVRATIPVAGG